ncbi:sulfatase family protein [Salegentibacter maritimus]|uniref:Sulfatase n=1 Tax=Salegentibacter maritimus TaxID=2794347 RepID=A0ABS0TKV3_9FLAO|nr:sulfatase [Salegentibacter maritimus]MBI6115901.1 sulfatase [Salegentibacter maritimus]MBI6121272.1 sulfatase [Salegentibacter maritimus]
MIFFKMGTKKIKLKKFRCNFTYLILALIPFAVLGCKTDTANDSKASKPNVVLIFLDDGAFDDFAPFGNPQYPTPNVETLAEEGRSFYNFYVPQAVCSASRAALLTGSYPGRTKVFGAHGPGEPGLDPQFATMGEVLQKNGYKTGIFGKWHLGDKPGHRSHDRGFEESSGLMYSNDMWSGHPENPEYWGKWPLQYWKNGEVVIDSVTAQHQTELTKWYTQDAVSFIEKNKDEPFFLYLPHSMPHVPVFAGEKFQGKSGTGVYGDVMMELDWSVGQVNDAIKKNGLEANTLFVFIASDNGPWLAYGDHAGITRFREGKGTIFEGGVRNPLIIKYPEEIKAGTITRKTFSSIDILPTICKLTNTPLPENEIDGKDVWDLIVDKPGAQNPHQYYPFSNDANLQGVMSSDGRWKLHLRHPYRTLSKAGVGGAPGSYYQEDLDTTLYDLLHDPYEKGNVIDSYPEKAKELLKLATQHQEKFYTE